MSNLHLNISYNVLWLLFGCFPLVTFWNNFLCCLSKFASELLLLSIWQLLFPEVINVKYNAFGIWTWICRCSVIEITPFIKCRNHLCRTSKSFTVWLWHCVSPGGGNLGWVNDNLFLYYSVWNPSHEKMNSYVELHCSPEGRVCHCRCGDVGRQRWSSLQRSDGKHDWERHFSLSIPKRKRVSHRKTAQTAS